MGESVVLTFENLYEVLRREKNNEDLQKLDENFFNHVNEYISEKRINLIGVSKKTDIFSHKEKENLNLQLSNIKKVLKDLYDLRERKIINLSLNKSKTNSKLIDTSALLRKEKQFFEKTSTILNESRNEFFKLFEQETNSEQFAVRGSQESQQTVNHELQTSNNKLQTPNSESQTNIVNIQFLQKVDMFIGRELEEYGPYDKNDVAELPKDLAEILISDRKAVKIV